LVILQAILGTKIIKIIPKIIQNYFWTQCTQRNANNELL
jgi:hypothetical protein